MAIDPERQERLRKALGEANLDALVCAAASDVLLLSGYWPVMSLSVAIFTADGECVLIVPQDEVHLAEQTSFATLIPFAPGSLTSFEPITAILKQFLAEAVQRLGLSAGCIGIREDLTEQPSSYVVSANFHGTLKTLLETVAPKAVLRASDDLLEKQKDAKTAVELRQMDTAVAIVSAGFAVAPGAIEAGLREIDVAARIQTAFDITPGAEQVQRSYGSFYCMSGPNSAKASAAFARTRERRLAQGDLVMIHANTCADGYWTDITRTYTVGEPGERHLALRGAISEARRKGLNAIRPGVRASDVDRAVRSVMEAQGLGEAFVHPTGHGVGFAAANAAGRPRIHPLSPDVLEVGSTFNLEPAAYFDGYGGMRHCDLVAVTRDGVRVLTEFA